LPRLVGLGFLALSPFKDLAYTALPHVMRYKRID
jgi:hypothetical protein